MNYPHIPSQLIDNSADLYFASMPTRKPWIQLELWRVGLISVIEITSCKECSGYQLPSLEIRAGNNRDLSIETNTIFTNHVCAHYGGSEIAGVKIVVTCKPIAIIGKYVTIQRIDSGITQLKVAEVDIYGKSTIAGTHIA